MTGRARVLVTDGEQRAALAIVRALGRAGHELVVCAFADRSLAGASRFASTEVTVPDPATGAEGYAEAVRALVARARLDVVIPVTDASCLALLPARGHLSGALVLGPSADSFRRISDKRAVRCAAADIGAFVPEQIVLERPGDAATDIPEELFPLVVKPSRSIPIDGGRTPGRAVVYAPNREELQRALGAYPDVAYPLLLQRRISGPGVGVFLLRWDGRTLAAFSHRRLREKPPTGGVSVDRVAVELDADLLSLCERLLAAHQWQGVAMIEFKRERDSGRLYLMEVNGRFWGSLQLAIDAGVDFPTLLLSAALGAPQRAVVDYRVGTRCRWWWGGVDYAIGVTRMGRESRQEFDLESPARAFFELVRPGGANSRLEVLRREDPRPFLRESVRWFRDLGSGR